MHLSSLFILLLTSFPLLAAAQGLNEVLANLTIFIDSTLIPFLFGMAFLVFLINVVRFFVIQSSNEDGREKARNLITYSVLAFVFLIIFWGMINLLVSSIGLEGCSQPMSDYELQNLVGPMPAGC